MAKTRREFSPEFKREAVALLDSSGRPLMQVAAGVGISLSMLRTGEQRLAGVGLDRSDGNLLRQEREILKRAATFSPRMG